jgi:hypothetical protein
MNFLFPERERGRLGLHLYNETEPPVQHHFFKKNVVVLPIIKKGEGLLFFTTSKKRGTNPQPEEWAETAARTIAGRQRKQHRNRPRILRPKGQHLERRGVPSKLQNTSRLRQSKTEQATQPSCADQIESIARPEQAGLRLLIGFSNKEDERCLPWPLCCCRFALSKLGTIFLVTLQGAMESPSRTTIALYDAHSSPWTGGVPFSLSCRLPRQENVYSTMGP